MRTRGSFVLGALAVLALAVAGCNTGKRSSGAPVPGSSSTGGTSPGTGTPGTGTPPAAAPNGLFYVSSFRQNFVKRYGNLRTVNGDQGPAATLSGAATLLAQPNYCGLFLDATRDHLYVANQQTNSVVVFHGASAKNGNAQPDRVLAGAQTQIAAPAGVFYDATRDLLYVACPNANKILVFDFGSGVTGNFPPARVISGAATTLARPSGIFVDTDSDRLYVANAGGPSVLVFETASTKNGNVAPSRRLAGPTTGLANCMGVTVDTVKNILYVSSRDAVVIQSWDLASTVTGDIRPNRTVSGASTKLDAPIQVLVDAQKDEIYVLNDIARAQEIKVWASASTKTGNVAPTRTIAGPNTGFDSIIGLAVDFTRQ